MSFITHWKCQISMIKGLEKLVVTWSQLKYVDSQQKRIDQSTTTATMDDSHCLAIYRKLYAASIHIYAMNICVRCVFGFIHAPQLAIKPVKKRFMNIQYACFGFVVPDSCWCCSINFNLHLNWFISFFSHTCDFFMFEFYPWEGEIYPWNPEEHDWYAKIMSIIKVLPESAFFFR